MRDLYLFAMANLLLCGAIGFISLCRLNAMRKGVLWRVRIEYAGYLGAAFAFGLQPLYGIWPGWGTLTMPVAMLAGLIASGKAWAGDVPPDIATDHAPLSELPPETLQ